MIISWQTLIFSLSFKEATTGRRLAGEEVTIGRVGSERQSLLKQILERMKISKNKNLLTAWLRIDCDFDSRLIVGGDWSAAQFSVCDSLCEIERKSFGRSLVEFS